MRCIHCGTDIADKALICFRCGNATAAPRVRPPERASVFERPRRSRAPLVWSAVAIGSIALLLWIFGLLGWRP